MVGHPQKQPEKLVRQISLPTARELAIVYFEAYNLRDSEAFRALFHDDATMVGITTVANGVDAIVKSCEKCWHSGGAEFEFLFDNKKCVHYDEDSNVAFGLVKYKAADGRIMNICDVFECRDGKIVSVTAYAGRSD